MSDTRSTIRNLSLARLKAIEITDVGGNELAQAAKVAWDIVAHGAATDAQIDIAIKAVETLQAARHAAGNSDCKKCEEALELFPLLKSSSAEHDLWKVAYTEAGNWARQYNTSRIAVAALLIPTTVALMTYGQDKPVWNEVRWFAGILWALLFVVTWRLTFLYLQNFKNHVIDARALGLPLLFRKELKNPSTLYIDTGMVAVIATVILGGGFCLLHPAHLSGANADSWTVQMSRSKTINGTHIHQTGTFTGSATHTNNAVPWSVQIAPQLPNFTTTP